MLALVGDEVVIGDDFGTDEAFLEVGVDDTSAFRCGSADLDGPGTHFLHASGEVGLQAQQLVTGADDAVQARLFHAQLVEEHLALFLVQLGDLGFDLVAHRHDAGAFVGGNAAHDIEVGIVLEAFLTDVGDVHGRLEGQEAETAHDLQVVIAETEAAQRLAFGQVRLDTFQHGLGGDGFLVAALGDTGQTLDAALDAVEIGQGQLDVDGLDVGGRVDVVGDVDDVVILEATHHVRDGVGLTDVGQELVAQTFALGSASDQTRDVDEFHGGRNHLLRLDDLGQRIQARVRHRHDTGVRLDGAEGEVLGVNARLGQCIEESGLADVRQADDAAIETHGARSWCDVSNGAWHWQSSRPAGSECTGTGHAGKRVGRHGMKTGGKCKASCRRGHPLGACRATNDAFCC